MKVHFCLISAVPCVIMMLFVAARRVQFAVSLKDQVVAEFMRVRAAGEAASRVVSQSVVTLSQFSTKAIYVIGAIVGLAVLGIDVRPLAAVGGMGGLAVGLGAQTLVESLLSGIQLVGAGHLQKGFRPMAMLPLSPDAFLCRCKPKSLLFLLYTSMILPLELSISQA